MIAALVKLAGGIRPILAIAAAGVIAGLAWLAYDAIWDRGYTARDVEQLTDDIAAWRERNRDDAHARELSDADLCREYLGARGVPVDEIEPVCGLLGQ